MKNTYKMLFLHGGPGLHAAVERAWFGDSLPVLWWDQPAVAADDPAPFLMLADHKKPNINDNAKLASLIQEE